MSFKPFIIDDASHYSSKQLRTLVDAHGLLVLRNNKLASTDEWRAFCQPFGDFLKWDFGDVNELIIKPDCPNYLYSNESVPLHWDGAFAQSPSLLMFYCKQSTGAGGETLFTDTQSILERESNEELDAWKNIKLQYQTKKLVHYGGAFTTRMIEKHPHTKQSTIRYAEPVETEKNPVELSVMGASTSKERFVKNMHEKLYNPKVCHAHTWEPGDIVIADNHRLLHGRHALQGNISRHILRIQII